MNATITRKPQVTLLKPLAMFSAPRLGPMVRSSMISMGAASDRVFTDTIKFQLIQDRCALLDAYKVGDDVKVTFNIKGSKWEKEGRTSYFVNLDVWKMEKLSESTSTPAVSQPVVESTPLPEGEDDLPF